MDQNAISDLQNFVISQMHQGLIVSRHPTGEVLYINPAATALFGLEQRPLAQLALASLFSESQDPQAYGKMLDALESAGYWNGELLFDNSSIGSKHLYVCVQKITHPQYGEILASFYLEQTFSNIIKAALEESENLRSRALQLAKIGHWWLEPETGNLKGTDELYEIFEVPRNASLEEFDRTVHPDDRESVATIIQLTIENGGTYDSSYRLITRNNNRKWVHAIGEARFDEEGKLTEIAGSVQDITSFRIVEEELQKMQKLKSLGVMAGGIAHDFNNIHTMLFGNISLARAKLGNKHPADEDLQIAEQAIHRATNLSNQLLTFAKGGVPVKRQIDVSKLVRDIVKFDLKGSNVGAEFEIEPGLWQINADQGQMEQVFTNLVINAQQAMPDGGILHIGMTNHRVQSGSLSALAPGKYVCIRVSDQGCGIREEHMQQIFDPYFSTKVSGSGLGLATVYSIISRHGGHIEVNSRSNEGTTFTLYISADEGQESTENQQRSAVENIQLEGKRILVMDDEQALCELARKILVMQGYQVDCAHDGKEAIAKYTGALNSGLPYSCVIMDLTIPGGMGGKEVIVELQGIDPQIKAIVSSGYAVDPVMANFDEYGFAGVIPKPYTPQAMISTVKSVLSQD